MPIKIFVTGGTFDKEYDEIKGQLYFNETHLPEILRLGRCTAVSYTHLTLPTSDLV